MSYRNTSYNRDSSKERANPNNLSKTRLTETVYSTNSGKNSNIPVRKDSLKNNPPPLPPKTKLKEEDLMTQSRIVQAKNGLQLLKKKMSQKGMISTKSSHKQEYIEEEETENVGYGRTPPKSKILSSQKELASKPDTEIKKKPANLTKTNSQKLPQTQYVSQEDDRPINSKNTNFEKMLEQQLRKQQANSNFSNKQPVMRTQNKYQQPSEYAAEEKLYQCRMGCERKFKKQILEKHQKICQKVFLEKRKAFDSAGQRHVQGQIEIPPKKPASKISTQKPKAPPKNQPSEASKASMPKWKLQSLQLRSGLKRATDKQLTKQQAQFQNLQKNALTQCTFCGRRFNDEAAKRHIPFCQQKAKKIATKPNPLLNTKKKW